MANNHMDLHDAYEVEIKGNKVLVDRGILDLVLLINAFSGMDTFTSCQGGSNCCRPDAYIGFTSIDPNKPKAIHEFLGFGRLSEDANTYELAFEVSELITLNQKHFPESAHWKDAFPFVHDVVDAAAEIRLGPRIADGTSHTA